MIHCELEKSEVGRMQADGSLNKFLASLRFKDRYGEEGRFQMDIPIEQQLVKGSKGEMVVFYQEELGDEE